MEGWSDLYVATAGASAALTGLIFVGVSISLPKILAASSLPGRALGSLVVLMLILTVSVFMLIPGQTRETVGYEIAITGALVWLSIIRLDIAIYRRTQLPYRRQQWISFTLDQFALIPYVIAGSLLVAGDEGGAYWIVPAILFSFIKAMLDAWVLLVEIHR